MLKVFANRRQHFPDMCQFAVLLTESSLAGRELTIFLMLKDDSIQIGGFRRKPGRQFPQGLEVGAISIGSTSMPFIRYGVAIFHLFL